MTESEAVALAPLLFAATAMTAAWLTARSGFSIRPVVVFGMAVLLTAAAFVAITRLQRSGAISFSLPRLTGYAAIVVGFAAYICWLAWPSLLPVAGGPDIVHHLSLVHFIQRRHALPHAGLGAYLGEMVSYTPGSHLLAALAADWFRVDAVRLIHPLQAIAVALKAGLIYNTVARILSSIPDGPQPRELSFAPAAREDASPYGRPQTRSVRYLPPAFAGTLLLLMPYRYLLEPVTAFGFYSQVIAETFAVAMLWTTVAWHQQPSRPWAVLTGVFGVAVVLSWPVYLPVPALAFGIVVLVQWWRRNRQTAAAFVDLLIALGPGVATLAIFSLRHASSAGILRSGGSVLVPAVDVFGWPFLFLTAVGVVITIRYARTTVPVLAFAAACAAQIAALAILQTLLGATNLYLANKMVFLLVYPGTIMAALALDTVWRAILDSRLVRSGASAELRFRATRARMFAAALPVLVVLPLLVNPPPLRPLRSPISEPVYRAGMWAKAHLPSQCVDYLVDDWLTGYWLHLDVLGNARATERMRTETFEYRPAVSRWILAGGLPFGVVDDLTAVPVDARRNMKVLHQSGPAAVVTRADGLGSCRDRTPPIDQVEVNAGR